MIFILLISRVDEVPEAMRHSEVEVPPVPQTYSMATTRLGTVTSKTLEVSQEFLMFTRNFHDTFQIKLSLGEVDDNARMVVRYRKAP